MKRQLLISWDGICDSTGHLFSFAKALSCAVKNSAYSDLAEDIVATSGFAFRMWVSADLCPSATSIWAFDEQKQWVENGGLICEYVGRSWGQDQIEEERRLEAIKIIKKSIDNGIPAISWDIGIPEWGLIIGYNNDTQMFNTLPIYANHADPSSPDYDAQQMPFNILGKRELPVLSVLTITGRSKKSQKDILNDTMRLAVNHLNGGEWCDNAKGLDTYPLLISIFEENPELASSWNAQYFLGTYCALKEYAYRYFEKEGIGQLAQIYKDVFYSWTQAFNIKTTEDANLPEVRSNIVGLLQSAYENEKKTVATMMKLIK